MERVNATTYAEMDSAWQQCAMDEDNDTLRQLVQYLAEYETTLTACLDQMEPCMLVQYAFKLARMSGKAVAALRIKDVDSHIALPRLMALSICRQVLADILTLLGVEPLERM